MFELKNFLKSQFPELAFGFSNWKRRFTSVFNRYNIDWIAFTCHRHYCRMLFSRPIQNQFMDIVQEYRTNDIVILEDLLSPNEVMQLASEFRQNISEGNILSTTDLYYPEQKSGLIRRVLDKFCRNVVVYYRFPRKWFIESLFVKEPLRNMPISREIYQNSILPIVSSIIGSPVELYRTFAYLTRNINGEETVNSQSGWHRDGDFDGSVKVIIYLNDVDRENGPFEYISKKSGVETSVRSKAGTTIIFNSRRLTHRASNTLSKERESFTFFCLPNVRDIVHDVEVAPDIIRPTFPFLSYKRARL